MTEGVAHPSHYGGDSVYETIKVLEAWLTPEQFIGFCRGNSLKYLARAGKKEGESATKDLAKAEFYSQYEQDYLKRLADGKVGEARAQMKPAVGGPINIKFQIGIDPGDEHQDRTVIAEMRAGMERFQEAYARGRAAR